jgi:hypothetical protein
MLIGIDPGVKTGIAVIGDCLNQTSSMPIHKAMERVRRLSRYKPFVYVEDARKRKWFGNNTRAKAQGAGSVKRDCKIWHDYLEDMKDQGMIAGYELVHPKNNATKLKADRFKKLTGYKERTNEHARDAYMLIYGKRSEQ